jgi:hypothetical protein
MGLVLLVLGLAALPAVSATTLAKVEPQPALHQCVETLESIPASAKGSPPVVHLSAAEGAVHSMTLGAVYDRGHIAPRAELSRVLIDSVGDNLDFIVVFTGFEFATGDALAFYSGVRNEVQGIGLPTFDHSAAFGSRGRLQGYVDMAALTRYALNTSEPAFQTPLNTLSHELMHRWGIAARFRTSTGTLSSDLLGRDGSHWSLAVDSSASIMYGARWSPLGGDQYRLTEARQRFSRWDLYLAGWASAAEVPPLYLLRDSPLDPNALPIVGQQVQARLETVRIEQLIEAEGERRPSSHESQRHFKAALVLLDRPGAAHDPERIAQLNRFAARFESYFQSITEGRASLRFHREGSAGARAGSPATLSGSPISRQADPVAAALSWLKSRQQSHGGFADHAHTAIRDTAAALAAIRLGDPGWAGAAAAESFLASQSPRNEDERLRRMVATASPDGSGPAFALQGRWTPSGFDIALAAALGVESDLFAAAERGDLLARVLGQQFDDGSFSTVSGGPSRLRASLYGARALFSGWPEGNNASERARNWLMAALLSAPMQGAQAAPVGELAEALEVAAQLRFPESLKLRLQQALEARQGEAGDWEGSVHTTATASSALARASLPNLQVAIVLHHPEHPVRGEPVALRARIRNTGGSPTPTTQLRWRRLDVAAGTSTPIAPDQPVPVLLPGEAHWLELLIETTSFAASNQLQAEVDPENSILELREDDNAKVLSLRLGEPEPSVDLAVLPNDQTLLPPRFRRIGERIELRGLVRNLGAIGASRVLVRLERVRASARTVLAEARVDTAALAQTPFVLEFEVQESGLHELDLSVDPEQASGDTRTENNRLRLQLPQDEGVDLALDPGSVVLAPDPPQIGAQASVRVNARNLGSRDPGPVTLELRRRRDGDEASIQRRTVQLDGTTALTVEFQWRPDFEGPHRLELVIDPDAAVDEIDEDNNRVFRDVNVVRSDGADLTVVPGTTRAIPAQPLQGRELRVESTLANLGQARAEPFSAALFLGDPRSGGVRLHAVNNLSLDSGQSLPVAFEVEEFPARGDVSLFVMVDSELQHAETNEANNLGVIDTIARSRPDLGTGPQEIEIEPPLPLPGIELRVRARLSNRGEQTSDPALVHLSAVAAGESRPIGSPISVPALAPSEIHVVEWLWQVDALPLNSLRVQIDPERSAVDGDRSNNEVDLPLNSAGEGSVALVPYFSPNGDGVRDRALVLFTTTRGAPAYAQVLDPSGREIRRLQEFQALAGDRVQLGWDGHDQQGALSADGSYEIVAADAAGRQLGNVRVVLDNNRPMALDSVNADHVVTRRLPASVNPWQVPATGSIAEDFLYAAGDNRNAAGPLKQGIARSHALFGGIEPVLSAAWIARHAGGGRVRDLQIEPRQGNELVFILGNAVWIQAVDLFDRPTRIAQLPEGAEQAVLVGYASERKVVLFDRTLDALWTLDLDSGGYAALAAPNGAREVLRLYPQGVLLGSDDRIEGGALPLRFVPSDPGLPAVELQLPFQPGYGCFARYQMMVNSPRLLFHTLGSEGESVEAVDLVSGQRRALFQSRESNCPGGSAESLAKRSSNVLGFSLVRAYWLEELQRIALIEHHAQRLRLFDERGEPIATYALPGVSRSGAYADREGVTVGASIRGEPIGPLDACPLRLDSDWQALAERDQLGRSVYSASRRELYFSSGELVLDAQPPDPAPDHPHEFVCHGATDYLALALDSGQVRRVAGQTAWPLEDAQDRARYPRATSSESAPSLPQAWPRFFQHGLARLRADARIAGSEDQMGRVWPLASGLLASVHDETRLLLTPSSESRELTTVVSSLDRLRAELRASSNGRSVSFTGYATDAHLDYYQIDYARAEAPEQWLSLVPPRREQVRGDTFMSWAPPQAGAYLFRLRAQDRAGNRADSFASADLVFASPLSNVLIDHRAISPNGDGVQDRAQLSFVVTRPTELGLRARDALGRTVFSADRVFGVDELGLQHWVWDGVDNSGQTLVDGDYQLELTAGFGFPLGIDTSAPLIGAGRLSPSYPPEHPDYAEFSGATDRRGSRNTSAELEVRLEQRGSQDAHWSRVEGAIARISLRDRLDGQLRLRRLQRLQARYRWVALDQAGNRALLELAAPAPALVLTGVGLVGLPGSNSWAIPGAEPRVLGEVAAHRVSNSHPMTRVLPVADEWVFFLADYDAPRPVILDLARSAGAPQPLAAALRWQTHFQGLPTALGDGLFGIQADFSGLEDGETIALRLRETAASPAARVSNSLRFNTPETRITGCAAGPDLLIETNLPQVPTQAALEARWPGDTRPPVRVVGVLRTQGADGRVQVIFSPISDLRGAQVELVLTLAGRDLALRLPLTLPVCDSGGGQSSGALPGALTVYPYSGGGCGAAASNSVVAVLGLPANSLAFRLELLDPSSAQPRQLAAGAASTVNADGYPIDTRNLAGSEGRLRLWVEVRAGEWLESEEAFPIDRTAPAVGINAPVPGTRVCSTHASLSGVDAYFNTDSRGFHLLEVASQAGAEPRYQPLRCNGAAATVAGCGGLDEAGPLRATALTERSFSRRLVSLPDPAVPEGPVRFRLRAVDWSGAQTCAHSDVHVDASVELDVRRDPLPASQDGVPLIAPEGLSEYRSAQWFYRSREALQLRAEIHATRSTGAPGAAGYEVDGPALVTLHNGAVGSGDIDLTWEGRIQAQVAADGVYALRLTARDDCGHTRILDRLVRVDSTAPLLELREPAAGALLRGPAVQVHGRVVDAHPDAFQLGFSTQGPQGPWQEFASGAGNISPPRVLGVLQTGGHSGEAWIRLAATDRVGNVAELVRGFRLAERSELLSTARLSRNLISPNGDGRADSLELRLVLSRQALLTVDLVRANGQAVARLVDGVATPAGPFVLPWGQAFDAAQTPEGGYRFEVSAREPGSATVPDTASLDFGIDLSPPVLRWTPAERSHLGCADGVALEVEDPHLAEFQAELRQTGAGAVRSLGGLAPGRFEFADFERISEGEYRVWAQALDLAGNRSERESAFVLDCTPPTISLAAPQESAVLARGAGYSHRIEGRVADLNPRDFAVQRAALAQPDQWQTLFDRQGAAPEGFAHDWAAEAADGDHRLRLRARDLAGNSSEHSVQIRIDGTPPLAEIFDPADGAVMRNSFQLGVVATDANFAELNLLIASPQQAARGQWSGLYRSTQPIERAYLPLLESADLGERVLRLEVLDRAGLKSHFDRRVVLDGTPPPTPIDLTATVEGGNVRLNWRGGEAPDLLGFNVFRHSGGEAVRLNPQPLTQRQHLDLDVADGEWHYEVSALDQVGNESARSAPTRVRVDRTPPDAAITQPRQDERVRGRLAIRGTAASRDDFARAELALLDAQGQLQRILAEHHLPVRAATLASLDTREHAEDARLQLRLRAWDHSGNRAEQVVAVQVDNLAPAPPQGLTGESLGADLELRWLPNSEPDLLGYLLYRNGRLLSAGTSLPADLRPLATRDVRQIDASVPDGELSYRVYAIDTAGNISPPSQPFSLVRDARPPSAQLLQPMEGQVFDRPLQLIASSEDLDIAHIAFAYRALGAAQWQPVGEPVTAAPWRQVLETAHLEFGDYELRALATDLGGLVDPQPPSVRVRFDDVTAPSAPSALNARALGARVVLSWPANSESDLDGYRLERFDAALGWVEIAQLAAAQTSHPDQDLDVGPYRYRLFAFDRSGNTSDASSEALAMVFEIDLHNLPHSPTRLQSIDVHGSSPRAGRLRLLRSVDGVSSGLGELPLANAQAFTVPAALLSGRNLIEAVLVDAEDNESLSAGFAVTRGEAPGAPASLQGSVNAHQVQLSWTAANAGVALAGFRVYRNGSPVLADTALGQTLRANEGNTEVPQVVDGSATTAWRERPPALSDRLARRLDLHWPQPALIGGVELEWLSAASSARDFDVYGWYDARWNLLAEVRNQEGGSYRLVLETAYPTQSLQIVPRRGQWPGAEHALAEVRVLSRSLSLQSEFVENVADGRHRYEVAAVSVLGFEGVRSSPWIAEVGDSTPPPPVVLSGNLSGRDAQLQWTASPAPDLRRYRLLRDGRLLAEIDATAARSYLDRGLANGLHRYHVEAEDLVGNRSEASNTLELEVVGAAPGAPVITAALPQLDAPALQLHWTAASSGAVGFRLFVSLQPDDPNEPYREIARPQSSPWLHTGLQYGQRLAYRIQAEDAFGNLSPMSARFIAEVRDLRTPASPVLTWPRFAPAAFDWRLPRYQVCGLAGADERVEVRVNARSLASLRAQTQTRLLPAVATSSTPVELAISADGQRIAWRDDNGALHQRELAGASSRPIGLRHLSQLRYGADGRTLHGWSAELAQMMAWSEDQGERLLDLGLQEVERALELEPGRWLALGQRDGQRALWLIDPARAQAQAIAYPQGEVARALLPHPGRSLAYIWAESGRIDRLDLVSAELTSLDVSGLEISDLQPEPGADALIALSEDNAERRIVRVTRAPPQLLLQIGAVVAFALQPDGSGAWLLSSDGLRLQRWGTSAPEIELALSTVPDARVLISAPGGLLAAIAPGVTNAIQPIRLAGAFCSPVLNVEPGLNLIEAVAENAAGVRSAPSAPLELRFDGTVASAPDLAVDAADIRLLPEPGVPGQPHSLAVHIANLGNIDAVDFAMEVELRDPQGQLTRFQRQQSLGANSGSIWVIPLGLLSQEGDYRVDVHLDRDNRLIETNELNNHARRSFTLRAGSGPWMRLTAAATQQPPGRAFEGQVTLSSAASFGGSIEMRVEDGAGALVQTLPSFSIGSLSSGAAYIRNWYWSPDSSLLAGDYVLHARLRGSQGQTVAEERLALAIEAQLLAQLELQPAVSEAPVGTAVAIRFGFDVPSANTVVPAAQLSLSAHPPTGPAQVLWTGDVGNLGMGTRFRRSLDWRTAALSAGSHELRLTLSAPGLQRSATRQVVLRAAAASSELRGELALLPAPSWALGQTAALEYRVSNGGSAALNGQALRLRVLSEPGRQELLGEQRSVDLAPAQSRGFQVDLAPLPQTPAPYLAVLEVQSEGSWRTLAQLGLQSNDVEAPMIDLLAPLSATPVRMPAALEAEIRDRHSRVELAEFSIDGGAWRSLPGGGNRFASVLNGLADGEHVLSLRARDVWGNQRQSEPRRIVVDSTPPAITVTGVADGGLYRQPVTPQFAAQDPHLLSVRGWLDGQLIESGQVLAREGAFRLEVQALDAAGNRAIRVLQFRLDFTAPTLQILSPAEGSQLGTASTAVEIQTEALARVSLVVGTWQAQLQADTEGRARFGDVPLQLGVNRIEARARDEAGNESQPVAVTVRRVEANGELSGDLHLNAPTHPRGTPLPIRAEVRNGTANAFDGELIVAIRSAGGSLLAERREPLQLGTGAARSLVFELSTADWPLGSAVAQLQVRSQSNLLQLAASGFDLLDTQAPSLQILQPQVAALSGSPLRVVVQASDDDAVAEVSYRVDQGAWTAFAPSSGDGRYEVALNLDDGVHSLQAQARDASGNVASTETRSFTIDASAPEIVIEGVADQGRYGEPVRPVVRMLDAHPARLQLRLNDQAFVSGSLVERSGRHVLEVEAEDQVGHLSQARIEFELDLDPVELELLAPDSGAILTAPATEISGRTKPGARVAARGPLSSHELVADAQGHFRVTSVQLQTGSNLLSVQATDAFGRTSPERSRTVFVDPAGSQGLSGALEVGSEIAVDRAFGVRAILREGLGVARGALQARVLLEREGVQLAERAWSTALAAGTQQPRELELPAQDTLGPVRLRLQVRLDEAWVQLAEASLPVVDRTPPTAEFLAPAADSYHATEIALRARAEDQHSSLAAVEVRERGGAWLRLQRKGDEWLGSLHPQDEGRSMLELRATDAAGNASAVSSRAIHVDRTAPRISVTGVSSGGLYAQPVQIGASAADASPTTLQIELDGQAVASGHWVQAHGPHRLRVRATDAAGNSSQVELDFELDLQPPSVQVTLPLAGAVIRAETTAVIGLTEGQAEVRLQLNGAELRQRANGQGQFRFDAVALRIGHNTLRLQATDRAGNIGEASSLVVERRGGFALTGALKAPAEAVIGAPLPIEFSVRNEAAHAQPLVRLQLIARDSAGKEFSLLDRRHDFAPGERLSLSASPDTRGWAAGTLSLRLLATDEVQVQLASASTQLRPSGPVLPPPLPRPVHIPAASSGALMLLALLLAALGVVGLAARGGRP